MWYPRRVEKTTLYLPGDLQAALRVLAQRTGRPQAALIREALERYVAGQERPRFASRGAAQDGTLTGEDAKAWVHERWAERDRTRRR
jgi:predicted DNA-binding protein